MIGSSLLCLLVVVPILLCTARNATTRALDPCTQPGPMCASCTEVAVCIWDGTSFKQTHVESCVYFMPCHTVDLVCSDRMSHCDLGVAFDCSGPGTFPDPFECNVYHECGPDPTLSSHKVICPQGKAFDALRGDCSMNIGHKLCTGMPVPPCTRVGQTGALEGNPRYYYVCVKEYPLLYMCKEGERYNATLYSCVPQDTHKGTFQ